MLLLLPSLPLLNRWCKFTKFAPHKRNLGEFHGNKCKKLSFVSNCISAYYIHFIRFHSIAKDCYFRPRLWVLETLSETILRGFFIWVAPRGLNFCCILAAFWLYFGTAARPRKRLSTPTTPLCISRAHQPA